jgi:hypothetical protein
VGIALEFEIADQLVAQGEVLFGGRGGIGVQTPEQLIESIFGNGRMKFLRMHATGRLSS